MWSDLTLRLAGLARVPNWDDSWSLAQELNMRLQRLGVWPDIAQTEHVQPDAMTKLLSAPTISCRFVAKRLV